mgnify:FL=1
MKSKIIHAYVGKTFHGFSDGGDYLRLPEFYMSKGQESEWDPDDWPPLKVRISIDVVEEKGGDE